MNVYLVQNLHNGLVLAAFTSGKVACAFADLVDVGRPDPDLQVVRVEVRKALPSLPSLGAPSP